MSLAFKRGSDADGALDIASVGRVGPGGRESIPVDEAALQMSELQEKNDDGSLKLNEDGAPTPLKGAALQAAAEQFADRNGLEVVGGRSSKPKKSDKEDS